MTDSPSNSTKFGKSKLAQTFISLFAFITIVVGLVFTGDSTFGGLLVVMSGILIFPKIRQLISRNANSENSKIPLFLRLFVGLLLITGIVISSGDLASTTLQEWESKKQVIILQVQKNIEQNDLVAAKKVLDKFNSAVLKDEQFNALKSQYQVAKEKTDAEVLAKKAEEKAANEKALTEKLIAEKAATEKVEAEKVAAEKIAAAQAAKEKAKKELESKSAATQAQQKPVVASKSGKSKVVSKLGGLVFLANGQEFGIGPPTVLIIEGVMYPNPSAKYIDEGYWCRFKAGSLYAEEVTCER